MKRLILVLAVLLPTLVNAGNGLNRISQHDSLSIQTIEEKNVRRDSLCRKYGKEFGQKLAEGKIDLGMTMEMCEEVVMRKCYTVRSSFDWENKRCQEWTFNMEKTLNFLAESTTDKDLFLLLAAQADQMSSGAFSKELKKEVPYKYLKFREEILIEFLEND